MYSYRYYGVVSMVPIFQYSNAYTATPKLRRLVVDKRAQEECLHAVSISGILSNRRYSYIFNLI